MIIMTAFYYRAYIMSPKMLYCQGLALDYLKYRKENIKLVRIEEEDFYKRGNEPNEKKLIRFDFDLSCEMYENEANKILYMLWNEMKTFLGKNVQNKLNDKCIRLYVGWRCEVTGVYNYDLKDGTLLNGKWVYYSTRGGFKDWQEANLFADVYGLDSYMRDITDLDDIDVEKWKNLKFLHLRTDQEQEVIDDVKAELMNMFPGVDVRINEHDDNEAQP